MRIRIDDPPSARDLVRFLRRRDYLAVEESEGLVEAVPINSVSERADRVRTLRELSDWMAQHPGVSAEPADDS
jgi:hypothetical protein